MQSRKAICSASAILNELIEIAESKIESAHKTDGIGRLSAKIDTLKQNYPVYLDIIRRIEDGLKANYGMDTEIELCSHDNVDECTGVDLGGTGEMVPKTFEVGGLPMHPSPQYFEKYFEKYCYWI